MAKIRSVFIGQATGSINDITYKVRGGKTIGSFKIDKKGRGGSFRQVVRRAQWGNLVNVFQSFQGDLHPSFEGRNALVSDFNLFIKANLGKNIFLTAEEVRLGAALAADYVITEGKLPSIVVSAGTGDVPVSNLGLGSLTIDATTTVAAFSQAIIRYNNGYVNGDQISCFYMKQLVNSNTQIPYVITKAQEITLNTSDTETLVRDVVDAEGFSSLDGFLALDQPIDGSVAWVHSRKDADGSTTVSRQEMYATNSILPSYQNQSKMMAAVISYGGKTTQDFLTPDNPNDYVLPN